MRLIKDPIMKSYMITSVGLNRVKLFTGKVIEVIITRDESTGLANTQYLELDPSLIADHSCDGKPAKGYFLSIFREASHG